MYKSIFYSIVTTTLALQLTACATIDGLLGGDGEKDEKKNDAFSVHDGEPTSDSLKRCALYTSPDMVLGGGLLFIISNPIVPLISLGYVGGKYGLCWYERQHDRPDVLDLGPVVDEASKRTEGKLKNVFIKASEKINERSDGVDRAVDNLDKRIKDTGEKEREEIEKTGAKVIQQIYEEIEVIKGSEFEIHQDSGGEYVPRKVRPSLHLDD